jgi:hypothetical protein
LTADPFASFLLKPKKGKKAVANKGSSSDETPEQQADDAQPVDEGMDGKLCLLVCALPCCFFDGGHVLKDEPLVLFLAEHNKIAGANATPQAIQHAKDVALAHRTAAFPAGKRGRNSGRS